MRILISGSQGFVGSSLCFFLIKEGHRVVPLVRTPKKEGVYWNPRVGEFRLGDFEGFDALIHLAGKSLVSQRWTKKVKDEILQSRQRDTGRLSQILCKLTHPPKVVVVASAVGYYGDRGKELLTEKSAPGSGFLSEVCQKWEAATSEIKQKGMRVSHARFGLILSPEGGALKKLMVPFRLGLGAVLGSGKQYLSWIAREDVARAIGHILKHEELQGAINVVSPFPETMASFSKKLANALHRPLVLRIGKRPLKWALGEMAEGLLLSSAKVIPAKLQSTGFVFKFPDLESYLRHHAMV